MQALIGRQLNNRYSLLEILGDGGSATVFRARDERLGRIVAVKVLNSRIITDPHLLQRFEYEARFAADVSTHPNIVATHDVGEDNGLHYLVMDYIPGRSLKSLIVERGSFSVEEAFEIVEQVASALAYAHQRGLVHRDIKPQNVLISDDGRVRVTDFGIARAVNVTGLTSTGLIIGTPAYLSPEQALGKPAGAGSDIYSLGVVLFEMVVGQLPFYAKDALTLVLLHVQQAPPSPQQYRSDLSTEASAVMLKALQKEPIDRYGSAGEFQQALQDARIGTRGLAAPSSSKSGEQTLVLPMPHPASGRSRQAAMLIPLLATGVLATLAVFFLGHRPRQVVLVNRAATSAPIVSHLLPLPRSTHTTNQSPHRAERPTPVTSPVQTATAQPQVPTAGVTRSLPTAPASPQPKRFVAAHRTPGSSRRYAVTAVSTFGGPGSAPGKLYDPEGVATDVQGNIYVADWGNNRVEKFSPTGRVLAVFGTGQAGAVSREFDGPSGIAVDDHGAMYVVDSKRNRVVKLSASGRVVAIYGSYGSRPGQFNGPHDIAVDNRGDMYVADYYNNRVQEIAPGGAVVLVVGNVTGGTAPGQFRFPVSVALDWRAHLFVADAMNHRIQKFHRSGALGAVITRWGRRATAPYLPHGIAVSRSGKIYVADYADDLVHVLSPNGRPVMQLGRRDRLPSLLDKPSSVAVDSAGTVYVADSAHDRIVRFASTP